MDLCQNLAGHNYVGHDYIAHNYIDCIGHNNIDYTDSTGVVAWTFAKTRRAITMWAMTT